MRLSSKTLNTHRIIPVATGVVSFEMISIEYIPVGIVLSYCD